MSERKFFYTNLADSVIYAGFKGHQYNVANSNIANLYQNILIELLNFLNDDRNSDIGIILTLNQICDNRFLNFENQEGNFKIISELIINGRLKISYFGEYDLVTYTLNALRNCVKRLCKGNTSPDMVYISSLFPELGIDNNDSTSRSRLKLLLGYDPTYLSYIEDEDLFELRTGDRLSFKHLETKSSRTNKYGLYTALKKYAENPAESDWLQIGYMTAFKTTGICRSIINWIKNLVELNNLAKKYNALVKNVSFDGERSLPRILSGILENNELLNEKLDLWLGNSQNLELIKEGIKEILRKLSKNSNRTAMYINIKSYMNEFAESHKDNRDLFRRFNTVTTNATGQLPYQKVFFTILNVIDYAYNLLNMFFSTSECTIIEGFSSFKIEAGRIIPEDQLHVSAKHYILDENGTLTASDSDNQKLNNIVRRLSKNKD